MPMTAVKPMPLIRASEGAAHMMGELEFTAALIDYTRKLLKAGKLHVEADAAAVPPKPNEMINTDHPSRLPVACSVSRKLTA